MDSVAVTIQNVLIAQQQAMLAGLVRSLFLFLVLPCIGAVIAGLSINSIISKRGIIKGLDDVVGSIEKDLQHKVSFSKFEQAKTETAESIRRTHQERERNDNVIHQRLDQHIKENTETNLKLNGTLNRILGFIDKATQDR